MEKEELFLEDGKIQDGAAALIAFGKMQFTDMGEKERESLTASLLQYCELDTLAMVMIYEHWLSLKDGWMVDDISEIVHRKQWDRALKRESYNNLFQYMDNYESDDLNSSSLTSRNIIM